MKNIDVVIPTSKNVEKSHYSICYTIKSILSQNIQPVNIFVVENAPETGVKQILHSNFGKLVHYVSGIDKYPNISHARNIGASSGNSDLIIFMDDDVVLGENDYFLKIIDIMKKNDFACGAKRYWTSTEWHKYLSLDYQMNHNLLILKDKSFLPVSISRTTGDKKCSEFSYIGNFGAIKRKVFHKIGGFDEDYEGWLYNDTDLMMRLCIRKYKYKILSYSNLFCYHLSHPADKDKYRKINKQKYMDKQMKLNIKFHSGNFFGRFDFEPTEVITRL